MRRKKIVFDVHLNVYLYELCRLANKQAPCGIAAFIVAPKSLQALGQRMAVSTESQSLVPLALKMILEIMPPETRKHDNWKIRLHIPQITLNQRIAHARADIENGGRKGGIDRKHTYALSDFKTMIELIDNGQLQIIEHEKTDLPPQLEFVKQAAKNMAIKCAELRFAEKTSAAGPFDERDLSTARSIKTKPSVDQTKKVA
jgi:hypothetical protein